MSVHGNAVSQLVGAELAADQAQPGSGQHFGEGRVCRPRGGSERFRCVDRGPTCKPPREGRRSRTVISQGILPEVAC